MYALPTVEQFKQQFPRDFPYANRAFGAAGTVALVATAVASIEVTAAGWGYSAAPTVTLVNYPGDTGSGATATATVANGEVTGFVIVTGGSGYLMPPTVQLTGGNGDNSNLKRVTDWDISGAITDAEFNVNPGIFCSESMFQRAFCYLAAHMLCDKLLMSAAGVQGQYSWLTASKSADGISQRFVLPKKISEIPFLASVSRTKYGAKYIEIVSPMLIGNMAPFLAVTNP